MRVADSFSRDVGYGRAPIPMLIANFERDFKDLGADSEGAWRVALSMIHQREEYYGGLAFHPDYDRLTKAGSKIAMNLFRTHLGLGIRTDS
jgi:hypothetical protein